MIHVIAILAVLAAGFGLGRVKNKAKLAAVQAELNKIKGELLPLEADAAAKFHVIVSRIEAKL